MLLQNHFEIYYAIVEHDTNADMTNVKKSTKIVSSSIKRLQHVSFLALV